MKKPATFIAMAGALLTGTVHAGQSSVIHAPVTSVEPITEWVTERVPHETCRDERVRVVDNSRSGSATSALLGAVIGGTMGGAIGHNSRHQPVIAGAGALLGASIGRDVGRQQSQNFHYTTETICTTDYEVREYEEITGYRVGYEFGGNTWYTRTRSEPGSNIRVRVSVTPLD